MRFLRPIRSVLFLMAILHLTTSCTEDEVANTSVVTEDIIFISGEIVRMTGRVLAIGGDKVDDHGFVIADNEGFASPITVSLGEKTIPGRFVGESRELDLQTTYFARSFVSVAGEVIYGNTQSFTTLSFTIVDFEPKNALPGAALRIVGTNFPSSTRVFFGSSEATIDEINFESEILLTVPPIDNSESLSISVQVEDEAVTFADDFEYIFGTWNLETVFPVEGEQYHETLALQSGDEFIFGLGRDFDFNTNPRIFSLNLINLQWNEISFPGIPPKNPFVSGGYFGSGGFATGPFYTTLNEFWEYQNGTFITRGLLPFSLDQSVAFTIDNQLYVTGGELVDGTINTNIYRYNETSGNWIIDGQTPIELTPDYPNFVVGNNAYFITDDASVWEFNPGSGAWNIVAVYPFFVSTDGVALVIDNKAYVGVFKDILNLYEFDVTDYSWKEKVGFAGNPSDDTVGSFVYGNRIYVMQSIARGGLGFIDPHMELWSFDPSALK